MTRTLRHFTPEEIEIIRADYSDYVDVRETAAKLGRDFGTVRQKILALGLTRDRSVFKMLRWCPEYLKPILKEKGSAAFVEAVNLHSEQLEQAEVSKSSEKETWIAAQIAEIDARPELERKEKMLAMRAIGLTLEQIGERFGITRERVRQLTAPDYCRPAAPQKGSLKNLLAINANLEARIIANKRRIRTKMLESLLSLWDSSDGDLRTEFLKTIKEWRRA